MGFADNASAVRSDVSNHAMNIFVEYFIQFPQHQNVFAGYKGKSPASLKSMGKFKDHTTKVVARLVDILEVAEDSGALNAECVAMGNMSQHNGLTVQQFADVGTVAIAYLKKTLGGAYDPSWQSRMDAFIAGMQGKL